VSRSALTVFSGCLALAAAGCGSGGGPAPPTIPPARTFTLAGFEPSGVVQPGEPVRVSFVIREPSGKILTRYRRGPGPHTRIHLIFVRSDLAVLVHRHPPLGRDGKARDTVTFPDPGRYRLVVDAFPSLSGSLRNFQLFRTIQVGASTAGTRLPPFRRTVEVDGYRIAVQGRPTVRVLEPAYLTVSVRDPAGRPAAFTPYFGALAHAIFFRAGDLSYFHTHACGARVPGCTTAFGRSRVTGSATRPGRLRIGVLLPQSGVWRLFLQFRTGGRVLTVPFTLRVR
jgi:hypothetical protein